MISPSDARATAGILAAFVRRDYSITRSYRLAFGLDAFYGVLHLAVYFFISEAFAGLSEGDFHGAPSYFAFAAVGMVLGLVVDASADGIAHRLRDEQVSGSLEALATQPLATAELCLGLAGFPLAFALTRAAVYLSIAALWMNLDVSETSWPGLVIMLVTTGASLVTLGILAGAAVLVFKRGSTFTNVLVFGMTVLAGAVFPISALPGWLEPLAKVIPLQFAFEGTRQALFTGTGWGTDALVLALFSAVTLPLAFAAFASALAYSKRSASLAQY